MNFERARNPNESMPDRFKICGPELNEICTELIDVVWNSGSNCCHLLSAEVEATIISKLKNKNIDGLVTYQEELPTAVILRQVQTTLTLKIPEVPENASIHTLCLKSF